MFGIIYKATNIINNKCYIGQTIKSIDARISEHYKNVSRNNITYFYNAIRLYKEENFIWEIIDEASSKKELNEKEKEWVWLYKSNDALYGYNMTEGGNGGATRIGRPHTIETKQKISQIHKGKKRSPLSEETKQKISDSEKGRIPWNKGMEYSEEQKQKLCHGPFSEERKANMKNKSGVNNPFYGKTHSDEWKLNKSKNHHNRRDDITIDKILDFINNGLSIKDIMKELNCSYKVIYTRMKVFKNEAI